MMNSGIISEEDKRKAGLFMASALEQGADMARISLSKSILDSFSFLNGELDKVSHSADCSVFIHLFVEGRYGTFSTNRLEESSIGDFIGRAIETTRMLAEDRCRTLADISRTAANARTGTELGLCDESYFSLDSSDRLRKAMSGCGFNKMKNTDSYKVISEEFEYSDSIDDNYLIDSNGFEGRHVETSFAVCSETTISDSGGLKYSGYWWDSSPFLNNLDISDCSETSLRRAAACMNPQKRRSGKYNMVVDCSVSSRLIAPVITALGAGNIQQKNSFLSESLGRKVFSEKLTVTDRATDFGKPGSRLFDTEGVATSERKVIEKGTVRMFFVNTYMSNKTGMAPTVEGISRPVVEESQNLKSDGKRVSLRDLMRHCRNGILVTGFNGGNCNSSTGNFSYGIEGFAFRDGKITHPVKEMVITGNMLELWNSLEAAGGDARSCTRWQIPSLAFRNVDFSA